MADGMSSQEQPDWLTREQLLALGFRFERPEIDFGVNWGKHQDVRLSFAPDGHSNRGFLYAYRRTDAMFAVLSAATTLQEIEAAWLTTAKGLHNPDGYLELAAVVNNEPAFTPHEARRLWLDCVAADFDARYRHEQLGTGAPDRFQAAHACVIARSARESAEQVYVNALRGSGAEPVLVGYRLIGRDDWRGVLAATDLESAKRDVECVRRLANRNGFEVRATSLAGDRGVLATAPVPGLTPAGLQAGHRVSPSELAM